MGSPILKMTKLEVKSAVRRLAVVAPIMPNRSVENSIAGTMRKMKGRK